MKRTPPYAFLRISRVFGAVWPTYWPTRSSRVTATRWPRSTYPSRWRISAMRRATVVFPVPGLPVKHICSEGRSDTSPCSRRRRSTTNSAAISRMRVLAGASPTSSPSSWSSTASSPVWRTTVCGLAARSVNWATADPIPLSAGEVVREAVRGSPGARGTTLKACSVTGSAIRARGPVALPGRDVRRIRVQAVVDGAVAPVRSLEAEARLVRRTVDDETQRCGLTTVARVVGDQLDVVVWKALAARRDFSHCEVGLVWRQIEQRQVPHLPVGVPGMRVVRVLDGDRPAVAQRVLDLRLDLFVGEIGEEGESALCDPHRVAPQATVGVTARSGVSVDSNSKVMSFQTSRAAFSSGQPFAALARMSGP